MGEPRGRQQSLRAWKGQDEDANLVRSLRRRRDLHAGIVQLGYVAVGFVLGFLLPLAERHFLFCCRLRGDILRRST